MASDVFGIVGTTQAGMFHVERVVAEGGFGVVYRAQHAAFRAPVALKCLKVPDSMTADQRAQFLDKFREEGELLFRLSASIPAVVRPLHVDVLNLDGRIVPFLALEWLEGDAFDDIIRRRAEQGKAPIGIERLVTLLSPIAGALARAHRFDGPGGRVAIIHRDLKPENIFVAQDHGAPAVKILDFGIARTRSAATVHAGRLTTEAGLSAFTPGYAAPEQWLPKRFGQTGPWTDVWGLAITMVDALTGRRPIDGEIEAMMGTTIDEGRRPTPRTEGATVPDAVERAFARALAVDPRARTQSIDAFWTELERALGMQPSIAPDASADRRARPDSSQPPPAPPARTRAASARADAATEADIPLRGEPAAAPAPEAIPSRRADRFDVPFELAASPRPTHTARPQTMATPRRPGLLDPRMRERLRGPLWLLLLGTALAIGDTLYTRSSGEPIAIASVRLSLVTGPIVLLAVALAVWRVVSAPEE